MTRIGSPSSPDAPQAAQAIAAPAGGRSAAGFAAPEETGTVSAAPPPSPALRMDPELGLVVLEFRDSRGEVTASAPTSRELEAYRRAARTGAPRPTG